MRVDAYLLLHTVLQRLGDRQASEETLKQAREWVNAIPDVGLRQRQENELVSLEVESALARNAGEATTLAANAINQFSAEGRTRRLPQLYLQLARARFRSNDLAGARNAIDQGLAAVDKQRVNVREARLRLSYFEEKWSLVEEGLAQRLVAADITASQSLAFLDKWRRPFFLAAPAKAGLTISPTLDDARAVVAYAMLPDKLVVWVMRGPNVERRVVNVTRHAIESQIANVKTLMAGARNETDAAGALTKLSQILLVPVADQLSGVRAIYISPDGVIGEVPFAALPLPSSDERLIDRAAVVMVPSVGADVEPASPLKTAKHVLIVAVSRAGDDELPELPGAADEARRVAAAYPGSTVDLHLDDLDADGFLRLAPSADTIHLAAHASINPLLPHLSRIYLKPSASHPSGILSAGEIAALTLQARLVVLAGCDTASGTPTRSEGVLGVTSAFLAAGAQTVVASLWPAEDRSSVAFQEHFHQSVAAGHSAAEALREAQLWARSNQTAVRPWSWAAWTVTQSHF
jgi:CHAT domain-containing protein